MNRYALVIIFMMVDLIHITHGMERKGILQQNSQKSPKKKVTFSPTVKQKNESVDHKPVDKPAPKGRFPYLTEETVVVGDDPLEQALIDALLPLIIEPDDDQDKELLEEELLLDESKTEKKN